MDEVQYTRSCQLAEKEVARRREQEEAIRERMRLDSEIQHMTELERASAQAAISVRFFFLSPMPVLSPL